MGREGFLRIFWRLVLVLFLGMAAPARAQYEAAFALPPPASILALPLLLLLIPLGMQLSKSDEARVRELEARGDWAGLAALAAKRLSEHPDDMYWHELSGRALQRLGRCGDAIPDLRVAFDARSAQAGQSVEAVFAVGLTLGLCEMAIRDLPAAAQTMNRLRTLAPESWEPDYNLGVIHALKGDLDAARAAAATLATKQPGMAAALQSRYIDPSGQAAPTGTPLAEPAAISTEPGAPRHVPAVPLEDLRLVIGNRVLALPPDNWFRAGTVHTSMRARRAQRDPWSEVPVSTVHGFALAGSNRLAGALAFSANPRQAFGMSLWEADEPCALPDAIYLERFQSSFYKPECLSLRVLDSSAALASPPLRPALQAATAAGATLPSASYEVRYANYGMDWAVSVTFLLPLQRLAGDMDAIQWAHGLANSLRRLARAPGLQEATVPPLSPMP